MKPLVECVPNVSEGRDPQVLDLLAAVVTQVPGVHLLDLHRDEDHHRAVLTCAGEPEAVAQAAFTLVQAAMERIDVSRHMGQHPRIGAVDVVPFVPLRDVTMAQCVELARAVGARIGTELEIPVFLYEEAAVVPQRKHLEHIRKGGLEALGRRMHTDALWRPDFGPPKLHPTAGAVVVGARDILIAFNVVLDTDNVAIAQAIAKQIRTSGGGLPALKALGIQLPSRGLVQVSMNLTNYRKTPLHVAFEAVKHQADQWGVGIVESELVGLVPQDAILHVAAHYLKLPHLASRQILETRLCEE
ncbi:MAG: glutamate formimidoyltransferase [Nitrospirae bacterium]|nr:MAG: glutamate formimidoyltransferase [Nitrospirota bacterium]